MSTPRARDCDDVPHDGYSCPRTDAAIGWYPYPYRHRAREEPQAEGATRSGVLPATEGDSGSCPQQLATGGRVPPPTFGPRVARWFHRVLASTARGVVSRRRRSCCSSAAAPSPAADVAPSTPFLHTTRRVSPDRPHRRPCPSPAGSAPPPAPPPSAWAPRVRRAADPLYSRTPRVARFLGSSDNLLDVRALAISSAPAGAAGPSCFASWPSAVFESGIASGSLPPRLARRSAL